VEADSTMLHSNECEAKITFISRAISDFLNTVSNEEDIRYVEEQEDDLCIGLVKNSRRHFKSDVPESTWDRKQHG
jgi:hypothetical protein